MDPISALKSGTEAISLVSALAKLIKETKKSNTTQPSLSELLARLQIDAVHLSRDLENRLRAVVERTQEYGINSALSIDQQLQDISWYNVFTRNRLKSLREECHAIYRQLTSFMDDATALLLCQDAVPLAKVAFQSSLDTKRQLDSLFLNSELPLGKILDGLLATASRVSAELQAA